MSLEIGSRNFTPAESAELYNEIYKGGKSIKHAISVYCYTGQNALVLTENSKIIRILHKCKNKNANTCNVIYLECAERIHTFLTTTFQYMDPCFCNLSDRIHSGRVTNPCFYLKHVRLNMDTCGTADYFAEASPPTVEGHAIRSKI